MKILKKNNNIDKTYKKNSKITAGKDIYNTLDEIILNKNEISQKKEIPIKKNTTNKKNILVKKKKGCIRRILGCMGCLLLLIVTFALTSGSIVLGVLQAFQNQLPSIDLKDYSPMVNTKVVDCKGRLIVELHKEENRMYKVPYHKISKNMINAVVAIEDKRFFYHYGFDLKRMAGVFIKLLKSKKIKGGASTITQQFARNAFLTREKTFSRKIKEILLAIKIEREFTKSEILQMYLNEITFGEGTYGIASASHVFFDKTPDELTINESALLAGCIQLPYAYSPYRFPKRSMKRKNIVLNCMYNEGYISKEEYELNKNAKIKLRKKTKEICHAPHFIYSYLIPELKKDKKIGEERLYDGNLTIKTTIDLDIQKKAEKAFNNAEIFKKFPENKFPKFQGALICMDIKTGQIKAMVGGRNFFLSRFNRAVQAKRQPGSLFKTIVYLTAIKNGVPPNKVINDKPREYTDPWSGEIWQPQNYKNRYHGLSTLRVALEHSYNIVAIELLKEIGIKNVIDLARKGGIKSPLKPTLSLALGSYEVAPIEILSFYSMIANQGIYNPPQNIISIFSKDEGLIEKSEYQGKPIVDAGACYIITNMLQGVVKEGSGIHARIKGHTIAGKTGTTNNSTDVWFCGFTPDIATIVYFGFDTPKPIGDHASGGKIAAPVWREFMKQVISEFPDSGFITPPNIIKKRICLESGLLASKECKRTAIQAFYRGTEPDLICNFHEFPFDDNNIFEESDDLDYTNGNKKKLLYNNNYKYKSFSSSSSND